MKCTETHSYIMHKCTMKHILPTLAIFAVAIEGAREPNAGGPAGEGEVTSANLRSDINGM